MIPQIPQMVQVGIHLQSRWYEKPKAVSAEDQEQKITEHGITYFKQDGKIKVKDEPIDFSKAKSEIKSLGHGGYNHFIGFNNKQTHEMIQFARYEPDNWYADVPINYGCGWDGYVWGCRTDTESVISTSKLFIEEFPWFDTLPFTMRRYRQKS